MNPNYNFSTLEEKFAGRSPRFRSLTRQLNLLETNLGSAVLAYQRISAESLARERIEKELEKEKNEKEIILKNLVAVIEKYEKISEEFKHIKQETEDQISLLQVKYQKLQEQEEMKEEKIIKLIEKMEQMTDFQREFQEKKAGEIDKLLTENNRLEKIHTQLKIELAFLQEKLQSCELVEKQERERDLAVVEENENQKDQNSLVEDQEVKMEISPGPIQLREEDEKKGFLNRFIKWWSEPVTTVDFSLIAFLKKSKPA